MRFLAWLSTRRLGALIALAALPYLFSAIWNHGFIASDEYWTGITRYIPAQTSSLSHLVQEDDVKSPVQLWPMHGFAQLALALGISHPFDQYKFVVFGLGILSTILLFSAVLYFPLSDLERRLAIFLLGFYAVAPSILTRPMFEAVAAPFLLWAALFAVRYDESERVGALLWGALFGALAFCFRPQTGICALIFPILPLMHRRGKDFVLVTLWGLFLLFVTGIPDWIYRGGWHHSLWYLIRYNADTGGAYGHEPWFYYLPLLFLASFGPWLIARYGKDWRQHYVRRFRTVLVMIALFILEHSLFTHKFERFIFPLIPLIILLLVPPVEFFLRDASRRQWRLGSLLVVNFLIWIPATFTEPQGHLIEIVRYFEAHPEIRQVASFGEAVTWLPDVFSQRSPVGITDSSWEQFAPGRFKCGDWVMVREPFAGRIESALPDFHVLQTFRPGIGDRVAFRLNPEHNVRRSAVVLMGCR